MRLFPANNIWNTPVDGLPLHSNSAMWIGHIQRGYSSSWNPANSFLRCDDVLPINYRSGVPLTRPSGLIDADPGLYCCPADAITEGHGTDGDHHTIVIQDGILYEFYSWGATEDKYNNAFAAKWDLGSNALRPAGPSSTDAGGLQVAAGIARYEEIESGEITHALRFTCGLTNEVFMWPARHYARVQSTWVPVAERPMMGMRCRLKSNFDISGFPPQAKIILQGLKKYGCMLADNGMPWGMQHDQDPRWNFDDVVTLHNVMGTNMEVVDSESLMVNVDSMITGDVSGCLMATDRLARPNMVPMGSSLGVVNGKIEVIGGSLRANIAPLQQQVASNVATENAATERLGGN